MTFYYQHKETIICCKAVFEDYVRVYLMQIIVYHYNGPNVFNNSFKFVKYT
jgi:hypothetical protein